MITEMDTRDVLQPYYKKRLKFEGVLVNVLPGTKKNDYKNELVFASVYGVHEHIELDHCVIRVKKGFVNKMKMQLFKRYHFTAEVIRYTKTIKIGRITAERELFGLTNVSESRLTEIDYSYIQQPSLYVRNRMYSSNESKDISNQKLSTLINDGSIEKWIIQKTAAQQKKKKTTDHIIAVTY